jgi:Ankyrin repeats (3 copies)
MLSDSFVSCHFRYRISSADSLYAFLVDYSAQAILMDLISQSNPNPHDQLAAICMARLKDNGFQASTLASADELDAALPSAPLDLLSYAYRSWSVHGREAIHEPSACSRLSAFVQECHAFPIYPGPLRNHFDRFGPLHVAAYFNLPPSLAGPDRLRNPNQPSQKDSLTPLHLACMHNSRLAVKDLLATPRILVNAPDRMGSTPLSWATRSHGRGDEEIIKLLLSHPKVKANQVDTHGYGPLHYAAKTGRANIVKPLLAHPKIKVNQADGSGITPLTYACMNDSRDVDTVKAFLAHPKVDVNATDKLGTTALMWMMSTAAPTDIVKAIFAHPKINLTLRDKFGHSTAYWIQHSRRKDIIELFKAHPKFRR